MPTKGWHLTRVASFFFVVFPDFGRSSMDKYFVNVETVEGFCMVRFFEDNIETGFGIFEYFFMMVFSVILSRCDFNEPDEKYIHHYFRVW